MEHVRQRPGFRGGRTGLGILIKAEELLTHITALASDKCAGRLPGDVGEEATLAYFERVFASLAAPFQVQRQRVEAIEIELTSEVSFSAKGVSIPIAVPDQCVAASEKQRKQVEVTDSDVVFVGYGIHAPELGWDDFKGLDVAGKTMLVLCGDPIRPEFRADELTYYGRWTYKYEEAGRRGAAAVFIIHETDRAGYAWDVVARSFGSHDFALKSANPDVRSLVDGWLTHEVAAQLLSADGHEYAQLKAAAQTPDFKPVSLGLKANAKVTATNLTDCVSHNFIATLRGADPEKADECVVYTAHWDHFGTNPKGVMSGAVDNGSGLAATLCVAKAFAELPERPPRTLMIMLPTLEEQNLLGSRYFVANPPAPYTVPNILAALNFEMLAPWGRSRTVSSVCKGHSSLDALFEDAAALQGRTIVGEPEPQKGYLYRSDHLPFMQAGVPALAVFFSAMDFMDERAKFIAFDYHKTSDKPKPDWDLSGAAADAALLFEVGHRILQTGYRATWHATSEFNPALSKRV